MDRRKDKTTDNADYTAKGQKDMTLLIILIAIVVILPILVKDAVDFGKDK